MQVVFRNKRIMPCWGSAERKAEMLAKYRTDPDKWFQRPEELLDVAFRPYFEQYNISSRRPTSQHIQVYTDAKGFFVYKRQKRKPHLVTVRPLRFYCAMPCRDSSCAESGCLVSFCTSFPLIIVAAVIVYVHDSCTAKSAQCCHIADGCRS